MCPTVLNHTAKGMQKCWMDTELSSTSSNSYQQILFNAEQCGGQTSIKNMLHQNVLPVVFTTTLVYLPIIRGDEWSLRAFASMPSTAIFLRARAEIKNLLCELASNTKIWGARASEHSFNILRANRAKVKFCEQLKIVMDHSSPL